MKTQFVDTRTKKSLTSLLKAIDKAEAICIDFETMSDGGGKKGNLEDWHPHSRTVCGSFTVAYNKELTDYATWVVPFTHPVSPWKNDWVIVLRNIIKRIKKNKVRIVAHNIKYDCRWAESMTGVDLSDLMWWDTAMADYILDENESHSLKSVAVRELGVENWADANLKDSESEDWSVLALYNARDTEYCLRLVPIQKARLMEERRLGRLFHYIGMPILRTLIRIERNGLPLDRAVVDKMRAESKALASEATERLMKVATEELGMDPEDYPTVSFKSATSKWFKEFMDLSGMPVIKYTATGNPSWDADCLQTLEEMGHEIAVDLAQARLHASRESKFFYPWVNKLAPDGRLHPSFNAMIVDDKWSDKKGTTTGRLSSSNPNAQQIARELKLCFGGEDDWLFVELDYSQIELRLAAWLAPIPAMLEAYKKGIDVHTLMASEITGKAIEDVTGDDRQGGKAGNFGFLYEMGEQTYVEYAWKTYRVKVDIDEARKVRRSFFSRWDGVERYHLRQKTIAMKNGFVRNPLGRKRRLPEIYESNYAEVGRAERRAINSPIQSMASDLMCLSLIEIDRVCDPEEVRLVGTVHDSLLAQVRKDTLEENIERIAAIMLDPGTERKFGVSVDVPLAVEAKIGYHWSDPEAEVRVFSN